MLTEENQAMFGFHDQVERVVDEHVHTAAASNTNHDLPMHRAAVCGNICDVRPEGRMSRRILNLERLFALSYFDGLLEAAMLETYTSGDEKSNGQSTLINAAMRTSSTLGRIAPAGNMGSPR